MKLLIISDADSIFMVEYAKALKKCIDVEITLYQAFPDRGWYEKLPYDNVYFDDITNKWYSNIKYLSFNFITPIIYRKRLKKWLKENDIHYDIIHIHRALPSWILGKDFYHNYCKKLFLTFWGGEFNGINGFKLFGSNKLYIRKTRKFLQSVDTVIGGMTDKRYLENFPIISTKREYGIFGSSIIEKLSEISQYDKCDIKRSLGIPEDKISVMAGYSGKAIHNHIRIIEGIEKAKDFCKIKNKIHFIAHMSRGGDRYYNSLVEKKLQESGCSYTMITSYCSDVEVARIRYSTDIIFQLTDFDGLSSSIKEYLCAGAIMISGDWFPGYHTLIEDGFFYEEVSSIEQGIEKFYDVINKVPTYKEKIKNNMQVAFNKYSWSNTIENWAEAYKKALYL